jgi:hypothetical protein
MLKSIEAHPRSLKASPRRWVSPWGPFTHTGVAEAHSATTETHHWATKIHNWALETPPGDVDCLLKAYPGDVEANRSRNLRITLEQAREVSPGAKGSLEPWRPILKSRGP